MHENLRRALDIAADQHALVTRAQARFAGLTDRMIDAAIADQFLVPVWRTVFRIRGAPQTERMAIAAATLATGGHGSHSTSARLLQLGAPLPPVPIHATVDGARRHPRCRVVPIETESVACFPVAVHRSDVAEARTLTVDGIPCADAARTIIDVAPWLALDDLEDVFERARHLGLVSTGALARRFEAIGGRGRPGTPKVRALLANARPNPLESKLEGKAWRMVRDSWIIEPVRQFRVDLPSRRWYRLDFAWPELMVAFETEGFEWHGTRARWKRDRSRVAALERLGWRLVVATWDDVVNWPAETLDRIAGALDERRQLARSA